MQAYLGNMTLTSNSFLSKFFGSEPTTSANPPVLIKGTDSDAANKIFFIVFPPLTIAQIYLYYTNRKA